MKNDHRRFDFFEKKGSIKTIYYMKINNKLIEVSKQVHATCRNSYRKINRDNERDIDIICNYENIEIIEKYCINNEDVNIIDIIYKNSLYKALRYLISQELTETEIDIIKYIFYEDKTERETADILNMPYSTLHNKKERILKKLKKILEQEGF